MDADKAESSPFLGMQMTDEEWTMNMDGKTVLDTYSELGGHVELVPNALGGYTYTGQARSVDALGKMVNNPIFGTTTTDLNSSVSFFNKMLADFSRGNTEYMASLKESSQNKIYDPAQLTQ